MKEKLGVTPELIAGSGGIFDVVVNDELVYSKSKTGTFPDFEKLVAQIAEKQGKE